MLPYRKGLELVTRLRSCTMAQPGRSWSSIAAGSGPQSQQPSVANSQSQHQGSQKGNAPTKQQQPSHSDMPSGSNSGQQKQQASQQQRSTSPHYTPKTSSHEDSVYVLTLLTDTKHHQTITKMREKYFPPRLNRLEAHLTLFHALPGSKLEDSIKPVLSEVSENTAPFPILAAKPFRLNKGIAIGVPKMKGGDDARQVHTQLKHAWKEFLSRQDGGGFAAHYTIMNKVDDESVVQKALSEVEAQWRGCRGTAEGLSLFLYERGNWVHVEDYRFSAVGT